MKWVSTNGWGADYVSENKELNCNKQMLKIVRNLIQFVSKFYKSLIIP